MSIHFWDLDVWWSNLLIILVSNEQFRSVFFISGIGKPFIYYYFFIVQITYNYRILRRMKLLLFKFISNEFVELPDNLLYHIREKKIFFHKRGQSGLFIKCTFFNILTNKPKFIFYLIFQVAAFSTNGYYWLFKITHIFCLSSTETLQ